ncbi:hypothetical protein KDU71_13735 [Carboxylicivirga sediminis]|uniref:HNH endonuclease n=1 Tax=Carboxylicivirga sediminis TaxID=2006564 RepID=A0A941F4I2_9BACT|nr:hypothetical protein [Carboxylicivirga sediminis]MBR8536631.1 hypothetical protein [Carboxylicivirga sediminis]
MVKCKLCNAKDADKKGSHIVPHFLLKRIENIEGKTGRDYELGFTIEKLNAKSYFGRSVQPEKLEETYGEITDADIAKNKHPLIVDNIFCSECESRLATIESKYAETTKTTNTKDYESGVSSIIGLLFWASVIWRMSINGKSGVKLTEEQNEKLRQTLDCFLPDKIEEIDKKGINENGLVKSLSYKILRSCDCKDDDAKWLFFHPEFNNPLCLLIDEYVVCFSFDDNFKDIDSKDCLGINEMIKQAPINKIGSDSNEIVKPFDNVTYKKMASSLLKIIQEVYLGGLDEFFDMVHVASGGKGKTMPSELKTEIMAELTSEEKKTGRKFTQEEIKKSTMKVMKRYAPK